METGTPGVWAYPTRWISLRCRKRRVLADARQHVGRGPNAAQHHGEALRCKHRVTAACCAQALRGSWRPMGSREGGSAPSPQRGAQCDRTAAHGDDAGRSTCDRQGTRSGGQAAILHVAGAGCISAHARNSLSGGATAPHPTAGIPETRATQQAPASHPPTPTHPRINTAQAGHTPPEVVVWLPLPVHIQLAERLAAALQQDLAHAHQAVPVVPLRAHARRRPGVP